MSVVAVSLKKPHIRYWRDWSSDVCSSDLRRTDYHVVHYTGYGRYDPRTGHGVLAFEGLRGPAHEVSGPEIGQLLHDNGSVRLTVLNACEGDRKSVVSGKSGDVGGRRIIKKTAH